MLGVVLILAGVYTYFAMKTGKPAETREVFKQETGNLAMDSIIYLVGLVVVIMAILSFFGLR